MKFKLFTKPNPLPDDSEFGQLQEIFEECFSTPAGKKVLNQLMKDFFVFRTCETDAERVLNEYGKLFLNVYLGKHGVTVEPRITGD